MSTESDDSVHVMDGLIDNVEELHSSPMVACRVLQLLKDPEFQVREVEKYLESDPALAASILRLVNSSCFGLSHKIASLQQAVTYLGTRSLRLVVLSFGLIDRLTRGTPAKVCEEYWRRALSMAAAASRLSQQQSGLRLDEAYSAGLLADVGVLVFAQVDTDWYVSMYGAQGHGRELIEAERERFGFAHPALGARLLARWNLPQPLTRAISRHHEQPGGNDPLGLVVSAADMLADVLWTPQGPRMPEVQQLLQSEFRLDLDGFITLAVECKQDIADSAELFRVELAGSIDCEALARSALHQYKAEAVQTALDWDSVASILEQDCGRGAQVPGLRPG